MICSEDLIKDFSKCNYQEAISYKSLKLVWAVMTEASRFCVTVRNIYHFTVHLMMTSSNGTIFRVTGPLCGEFTGPGEFPAQRPVTRSFDVFLDLGLNKWLSDNREAGDLRRHHGHYDVNVMLNLKLDVFILRGLGNTYELGYYWSRSWIEICLLPTKMLVMSPLSEHRSFKTYLNKTLMIVWLSRKYLLENYRHFISEAKQLMILKNRQPDLINLLIL